MTLFWGVQKHTDVYLSIPLYMFSKCTWIHTEYCIHGLKKFHGDLRCFTVRSSTNPSFWKTKIRSHHLPPFPKFFLPIASCERSSLCLCARVCARVAATGCQNLAQASFSASARSNAFAYLHLLISVQISVFSGKSAFLK